MDLSYHTQIYGVTQSGKSLIGLKLLSEQTGLKLFIDTKNETKYHKYFHMFADIDTIQVLLENEKELNGKMICVRIEPKEFEKQLERFAEIVFVYKRSNPIYRLTILIDEFQEYVSRATKGFIRALFVQGLSKNIRVIFTSQGWSMIPKNIRNNCEMSLVGKQRKNDIESMMDQGLIPYEYNDKGWRVHNLDFSKPYTFYGEYGIGKGMKKVQ